MDLEEQLRRALRPKNPPAGFASRVIKRTLTRRGACPERSEWALPSPAKRERALRAAAAAIMLSALLGAWTAYEIAGERAREKVLLALHIAGSKVRYAQTQVHGIGH
jgi:hypothetical protein